MIEDVFVASLMSSDVKTVGKDATVREAAQIMNANGIGSLLITGENDELDGIITGSDVVRVTANGQDVDDTTVSDAMSTGLLTVSASENIQKASNILMKNEIHHLPVVDDDEVIGILTTTDITSYISSVIDPSP